MLSMPTTGRSPVSAPTKLAANFSAFEASVTQNPATPALEAPTAFSTSFVTDWRSTYEAFSLSVLVETQDEIDTLSAALIDGGGSQGPCGWLVDAFGLSWQIVPSALFRLMGDPDQEKAGRVRDAMLGMTKLDIAGLQAAHDG